MARIGAAWLCVVLAGCGSQVDERFEEGLRRLAAVVEANGQGAADLDFRVLPGESALMITAHTADPMRNHVRGLEAPSHGQVFDAFAQAYTVRSKTNGGYVASVSSLNWPILDIDPGLEEGRWTVSLGHVDPSDAWSPGEIAVDVLLKEDPDLGGGELHASIVYAAHMADDPDVVEATEQAVEVWAQLYEKLGISLSWDYYEYDGGGLEPPALGSPEAYEEISAMTPLRTINVVIAPRIVGYDRVYGIAGDIPGPLVSSSKSAVLVSALLAAGVDGRFSEEDVRLYGETMAHEAGHYLGLFHPVETDFQTWDALDDTPECDSEAECVRELSRNLMFPYPPCTTLGCDPQDQLTRDQAGVANRHVVVR